ncbi:hypothetical protein [Agromyces larvae]|uniref:DUF86 domain-containing protein n=1 Tax=Agromyces larvae TaxID=2929802 RepID=A0ABY4C2B0_9MICO|nr:hypothetical protein [Agromyces larvae]UOE45623.1 hypothetical protein MTO99_07710 [Agromyces larvae]
MLGTAREAFFDGSPSYDAASMVVVRLYGLLERADSGDLRATLTEDEIAALRTMRNIVAHGGDARMNDESFWTTSTRELPVVVTRLQRAIATPSAADDDGAPSE